MSLKNNYESILPQVEAQTVAIDPLSPPVRPSSAIRRSTLKKIGLAFLVVSLVVAISFAILENTRGSPTPPPPPVQMEGASMKDEPYMGAHQGPPPPPSPQELEGTWGWWNDIRNQVVHTYHSVVHEVKKVVNKTEDAFDDAYKSISHSIKVTSVHAVNVTIQGVKHLVNVTVHAINVTVHGVHKAANITLHDVNWTHVCNYSEYEDWNPEWNATAVWEKSYYNVQVEGSDDYYNPCNMSLIEENIGKILNNAHTYWENHNDNNNNDFDYGELAAVGPNDILGNSPYKLVKKIDKEMKKQEKDGISEMIYMNHEDGMNVLVSAYTGSHHSSKDYFLLVQGTDSPINQVYSGVASSAAALNSYRGKIELPVDPNYYPFEYVTQMDIFNECTKQNAVIKNSTFDGIQVPPGGLVMGQVKNIIECNLPHEKAWTVDITYVDPHRVSLEKVRKKILEALEHPKKRVIAFYDRAVVHQDGGAHYSPIGAYSKDKDAFLVVDVSQYRYPDVWIPARHLYDAMSTGDICGTWDYPHAQEDLPPEVLYTRDEHAYLKALKHLGCRPKHRGFIIVSVE